jgi:hypothetical protein
MAAKRQRNYAAEYARRQQRAREQGFGSYYQRRVAGTRPGTEERARASGHRSFRDLLRSIKEGSIVSIDPVESTRNARGQWTVVAITILDEYGDERTFWLTEKQLTDERIRQLIQTIDDKGAIQSPSYPAANLYAGYLVEIDGDVYEM